VVEGIAAVRRFIELHGESRFTPWEGDDQRRPTINRVGFRRSDRSGGTEYFVLPEAWRTELCSGHDAYMLARELEH